MKQGSNYGKQAMIAGVLCVISLLGGLFLSPHHVTPPVHPTGLNEPVPTAVHLSRFGDRLASLPRYPAKVNLSRWSPPVGNQEQVSSCVPWATAYYYRYWLAARAGDTPPVESFSPMFQYNLVTHGQDTGTTFETNLAIETKQGAIPNSEYSAGPDAGQYDYTVAPTRSDKITAHRWRVHDFFPLYSGAPRSQDETVESVIKGYMSTMRKPVLLGLSVYASFMYSGQTYPLLIDAHADGEEYFGNHAAFVDHYDATGIWIRNSWGPDWSDRGLGHATWNFVNHDVFEVWEVGGPDRGVTPPAVRHRLPRLE